MEIGPGEMLSGRDLRIPTKDRVKTSNYRVL